MPSISASGLGSGLDVNSLVTQLIAAEREPADQRLAALQSRAQVRLSALGSYRSALASLHSAVEALRSNGSFGTLAAQSSDSSLFTASASGAVAGSYGVEVVALARANKLASGTYASASSALGSGDVTLTVAGNSFTVSLGSGSDTVAHLRDAINGASNNTGVTATLVNDVAGTRLLLTARQTGLANAVSVSTTLATFSQTQTALDAHVRVDGYDAYSAVNSVSGVIDGITLNLIKSAPGSSATLTVGVDNKAASEAAQKFVSAYNALITTATNLTRYNASTNSAAALTGDATVRDASRQLRSILGGTVSGAGNYSQLWQIGITTNTDGSLKLDSSKLSTALAADFSSIRNLFGASGGYASQLDSALDGYLNSGGRLDSMTEAVKSQISEVSDQKTLLERRMDLAEQRYRAQFSALDTLISQLKTTSDFLSSQLAMLSRNDR